MITLKKICNICFSVFLLSSPIAVLAQDNAEREHLTALVRQLQLMQQMSNNHVELYKSNPNRSRYYFDYKRLNADLKHIENGINDYLAPKRAQPRDPLELNGQYQRLNSGAGDE